VRRVRLNAQGKPLDCAEIVRVPPGRALNERGMATSGGPLWKVRIDSAGRVTGIAGVTFPRLENYKATLTSGKTITVAEMTAKEITRSQVDKTTERPTCEAANRWPIELGLAPGESIDWSKVWDTFKIGLATPVDFGSAVSNDPWRPGHAQQMAGSRGLQTRMRLPNRKTYTYYRVPQAPQPME
jgi:hypothetical protein